MNSQQFHVIIWKGYVESFLLSHPIDSQLKLFLKSSFETILHFFDQKRDGIGLHLIFNLTVQIFEAAKD